jgi:AraC family transcriptional regulator of adaptative response / DNA-3-methyladenine glycosylase II
LAGQLILLHGRPVPEENRTHPGLSHIFPSAECLASAASIGLAIPGARQSSLKALAEAATADLNLFRPFGAIDEAVTRLRSIRGVGEWTAHYIALRAIREMDAFPASDIGLLRGAEKLDGVRSSASSLLNRAELWRPWRAYAAQHLWAADAACVAINSDAMHGVSNG